MCARRPVYSEESLEPGPGERRDGESMISKANQLASITAVGVSAIALTSGKAEAATIDSGILNTHIVFQNNSNPGNFAEAASALFHSLAGGPSFAIRLFSVASSNGTYNRFAVQSMNTGGVFKDPRVAAGATWNNAISNGTQYGRLGYRRWGASNTTTHGLPSVTDAYSLFRFTGGSGVEYGWLEFSVSVVNANSAAAAAGPNITVVQYAFDDTGATIAAGDGAVTPEPSSIAESGLAALILGAEGLRRWRKARRVAPLDIGCQ